LKEPLAQTGWRALIFFFPILDTLQKTFLWILEMGQCLRESESLTREFDTV
jgi:hypothetical protein